VGYGIITMKRFFLMLLVSLILAACEAQSTPIAAVNTPTAIAEPILTMPPQIRYGLYTNVIGFVPNIDILREVALVESMTAESAISDYDVVVAYGIYEGWQQSPISQQVSLIINPNLAPLDDEDIRNIVRQAIDSQAISEILNISGLLPRTTQTVSSTETKIALANVGYPDGFVLTMAVEAIPSLEVIAAQFTQRNIDLRIIENEANTLSNNRAHLMLALWTQESQNIAWVEQVGEANVLDLFTLPISYIASDTLNITFTENGFPLPAR
jgi:hypothetical protein